MLKMTNVMTGAPVYINPGSIIAFEEVELIGAECSSVVGHGSRVTLLGCQERFIIHESPDDILTGLKLVNSKCVESHLNIIKRAQREDWQDDDEEL